MGRTAFSLVVFLLLALDVIWWRWADVRLRPLVGSWRYRLLLAGFMSFQILAQAFRVIHISFIRNGMDSGMGSPFLAMVYIWHLLILPGTLLTLLGWWLSRRLASWLRTLLQAMAHASAPPPSPPQDESATRLTRRQVLAGIGVAVPPLVLAATVGAGIEQVGSFRIRNIAVKLARLPPGLDGMTIAHVSDTHIGGFLRPHMLPRIVSAVNALGCDMVAFTGDLIDIDLKYLPGGLAALDAMRPRDNLVMCIGNHDQIQSRAWFIQTAREMGMPLLIDQDMNLRIRGHDVQVLGIDFQRGLSGVAASVARVETLRRHDVLSILLSHHPHAFDAAAGCGIPLTLSGHTHGGQLMLTPGFGAGSILFRYISGLYRKDNGSALVVSNGVGNWFPLRVNAPAEIVKITLTR